MFLDLGSSFFNGKESDEKLLIVWASKASSINAVGRESVEFLKNNNYVDETNIKKIDSIPFVVVVLEWKMFIL